MTTFVSYAQNFEDVLLWRALKDVDAGCYVDIGANSPVIDSVSLAFYERGWRGVNVEPSSGYFAELEELRPGDLNVHAAVSAQVGLAAFHEVADTGLSTMLGDIASAHAEAGFDVSGTKVATITLDNLLDGVSAEQIHWMKIDVEGAEREVIESWKTSLHRPWIILVESVDPITRAECHQDWEPMLLAKGYEFVHFDGLNRYYLSNERDYLSVFFRVGPNVFDAFSLSGTATSMFSALLSHRLSEVTAQADASTSEFGEKLELLHADLDVVSKKNAELEAALSHQAFDFSEREARLIGEHEARMVSQRAAHEDLMTRSIGQFGEMLAEQNRKRDDELAQLRTRFEEEQRRERAAASQTLSGIEYRLAGVAADAEAARAQSDRMEADLQQQGVILLAAEDSLRVAQLHLGKLLTSTSWRIIAPLRMVSTFVRGRRKEAGTYFNEIIKDLSRIPWARRVANRLLPADGRLKGILIARAFSSNAVSSGAVVGASSMHGVSNGMRGRMIARMNGSMRKRRVSRGSAE